MSAASFFNFSFPSGDQCCDALAYPCSESSSSLGAPLPCQAADQMWYLLCLPVYLPIHSHRLRHSHGSRSKEVFAAEDGAWLCANQGNPFQAPPFCSRLIESVRMMACVICASHWEASHCLAYVTASTSRIRLEVVTLWAPLSLCTFAKERERGKEREKEKERDRQTETEREWDRQTDWQRQRERMCMWMSVCVCVCVCVCVGVRVCVGVCR